MTNDYNAPRVVDSAGEVYESYPLGFHAPSHAALADVCDYILARCQNRQMWTIGREIRRQHRHDWRQMTEQVPNFWNYHCTKWGDEIRQYQRPLATVVPDFLPAELAALESKWHPTPVNDVKE